MYYSASGTYSNENFVYAGSVVVADEQTRVESNLNPDGIANLVYRVVPTNSKQAGDVILNSAASISIDNYGTTSSDNSYDYGAYKCTPDSDFEYTLCVASPQDSEITQFTAFVAIPNKLRDTASIQNKSFKNYWNTTLKGITVNASTAKYKLYYTTDTPKADNSENYTGYTGTLDDSVLSQITKIKITADRVYNGDTIKFRLAYCDGFNAQDVNDSIYMSSTYSYTNAQLGISPSGVTNAVQYQFGQIRVIYDANGGSGNVPTDSRVYSSGDEVIVKDGGTLFKQNYIFDGWSLNGVKVSSFVITDTTTLYAVWKPATPSPFDTDPNPPVGTDPNPPVGTDPNPPVGTDPNPPVGTDPNPPVGTDPNPPVCTDPNPPVSTDPNPPVSTDPNLPVGTAPHLPVNPDPNLTVVNPTLPAVTPTSPILTDTISKDGTTGTSEETTSPERSKGSSDETTSSATNPKTGNSTSCVFMAVVISIAGISIIKRKK